ncbi:MAG: thiolase domain-containing protein [Bacillota bacterium]
MRKVALVSADQSRFGEFGSMGIKELFQEAYRETLEGLDYPLEGRRIQAAYIGSLGVGGFQLGQSAPLLTTHLGLGAIPSVRVENACASGGYALLEAIRAVASGEHDLVLAAGVEKMRDMSSSKGRYWLGVSGDTEYERLAGLTFAGIYALMASRYMHEYGAKKRHLAMVAVKNHANGVKNPKAHMRKAISLEQAMAAPNVAWPLGLFDCSLTSDGAACALVAPLEMAIEFTKKPVAVVGYGAASDHLAVHDREVVTSLGASVEAGRRAMAMAGMGPGDIQVAEVHDCFTIAEILAYEDLGFCARGQAPRLLEEGFTLNGGRVAVNPSGGLKSKGHPLGATGVAQAAEIFHQLRDECGARQVKGAHTGLSHNVGGSGGSASVVIYQRA